MTRPDQTRPDQTALHGLISVIIPVYNIEKYIARCIESVIAQTYHNLEILLIDDGSTDSSGRICDEYSAKDSRIRVIHQENKGLAEVRNVGLREAKGEWIQFVDGDDWIDPETLQSCYSYAQEYNADIVCFRYVHEYEDGRQDYENNKPSPPVLIGTSDALSAVMLPQYVDVSSCNKLIKSDLFSGITYPSGKTGEDGYTTHKFIAKANRILVISSVFYHYFKRNGSISRSAMSDSISNTAAYAQEYCDFATKSGLIKTRAQKDNFLCGCWFRKICYANGTIVYDCQDSEYIAKLRKEIRPSVVMRCRLLSFKRKVQFILFKLSTNIYKAVYTRFKR